VVMTIIQRARRDVVGWPLRGSAGAALIAARLSPAGSRGGDEHGVSVYRIGFHFGA